MVQDVRESSQHIVVGKITKAHGIRGEVKIHSYSGEPENFSHYKELYFKDGQSQGVRPLTIERCRVQTGMVLVKLKGVDTRNDAEQLVNLEVRITEDDLRPLEEGQYYWHDFVDKVVKTQDGRIVGRVQAIFNSGAHDILTILDGEREYLIPLREEFILSVNDEIRVNLPPGLLDINES